MNNLQMSFKRFLGNKNTVTILGVILCIIILYVGYNWRIKKEVTLVRIPYAAETIQPRTLITADMVEYMEVPIQFLNEQSEYYRNAEDIVGKYSNYNTLIAAGSLFYTDLVTVESSLPNSAFLDIVENDTPINYRVNMDTTYANSMMPGDYINIYLKGTADDGSIMFGKFISNIEILAVKDSGGRHVFENTTEARTPAYMLFALPEDFHLLFRKALYLQNVAGIEITLVPSTEEKDKEGRPYVSSEDIKNFIENKTKDVNVSVILSETASQVGSSTSNTEDNDSGW